MAPTFDSRDILPIIADERVDAVFQPIFDLGRGELFGYEGLIRGPGDGPFHSPLALFEAAAHEKRLEALETLCRRKVCRRFQELQLPGKLFLNVTPMTLVETGYRSGVTGEILSEVGLDPARVVIELTEQYPLADYTLMREATAHYRKQGYQIALDDLGAGYSSLRIWSEILPDYVKIDRHFIENLALDARKREFVKSIEAIARRLGCKVIAEGIESDAELRALAGMGVDFGQGFGLGRPEPRPGTTVPLALRAVSGGRLALARTLHDAAAGSLAQPWPVFAPETPAELVFEQLRADRRLAAAPIVDHGRVLGLVERDDMLELFSGRYMRELHARKPIRQLLSPVAVVVDEHDPLELVSRHLTGAGPGRLPECFIVTRAGSYRGMAQTRDLLERITRQQIHAARYSNPLTGLPGNVPLYEAVDALLGDRRLFTVACFDLNQFKPFNDVFGYSQGDRVIQLVGDLLLTHTDRERDFVGHAGGDDFVVIFGTPEWHDRCRAIVAEFDAGARRFYDAGALAAGGIWGEDRRSKPRFFELISLAVGVVQPDAALCVSHHDVAALATAAKHEAKKRPGSFIHVSRQRGPAGGSGEHRAEAAAATAQPGPMAELRPELIQPANDRERAAAYP